MSKFSTLENPESLIEEDFIRIVGIYYPEDVGRVAQMSVEEKLGYIYCRMLGGVEYPGKELLNEGIGGGSDEI